MRSTLQENYRTLTNDTIGNTGRKCAIRNALGRTALMALFRSMSSRRLSDRVCQTVSQCEAVAAALDHAAAAEVARQLLRRDAFVARYPELQSALIGVDLSGSDSNRSCARLRWRRAPSGECWSLPRTPRRPCCRRPRAPRPYARGTDYGSFRLTETVSQTPMLCVAGGDSISVSTTGPSGTSMAIWI